MTTKYLTGDYPGGYTLSANYRSLVVESSASVSGVTADFKASITNYSAIGNIYLLAGGTVTNGSAHEGSAQISRITAAYGSVDVRNFGAIEDISLVFGGMVTNGSATDARAQIGEIFASHASAVVSNFGTIGFVYTAAGGMVTNGSTADTRAFISVFVARNVSATVVNDGTIASTRLGGYVGVYLGSGGIVTNGSANDTTALIQSAPYYYQASDAGVYSKKAPALITNFGTIQAVNARSAVGVRLGDGGSVINGSTGDNAALIEGIYASTVSANVINFGTIFGRNTGVDLGGGGTVDNFGSIAGVEVGSKQTPGASGIVINGSATNAIALISGGRYGVFADYSSVVSVTNYGTIRGTDGAAVDLTSGGAVTNFGAILEVGGAAIRLASGGAVINGSASDSNVMISGNSGVYCINDAATLTNFGTVEGTRFAGAFVSAGGSVTNGSATDANALISGGYGVYAGPTGATTVTNFGVISGTEGISIWLAAATDRLVAESGSAFLGAVQGGGGTLELGSGVGTISALGTTGPDAMATISGAEAMIFTGFNTYQIDAGSLWTLEGINIVGSAQALTVEGTLTVNGGLTIIGTLTSTGVLTLDGSISGTGALTIVGGMASIGDSLVFKGVFSESASATVVVAEGDKLALAGSAMLYGTVNGTGIVSLATATVDGLTVGGKAILEAMGTVDQSGTVTLGDTVPGAATLSISKTGAWEIGSGSIAKGAGGGGSTKVYGLLIKNAGTGVSTVGVTTYDYGTIEVGVGTLDFANQLFGTGSLKIGAGGTLEADRSAIKTLMVDFGGTDATLAMRFAKTFAATISGFTAGDTLDLLKTKATGASVNGSDQLVIVNGTTTVAILQLAGSFAGTTFGVGSDGNGGTDVTIANAGGVLQPTMMPAPSTHPMVIAMAGMATSSGLSAVVHDPDAVHPSMLSRPGTQVV